MRTHYLLIVAAHLLATALLVGGCASEGEPSLPAAATPPDTPLVSPTSTVAVPTAPAVEAAATIAAEVTAAATAVPTATAEALPVIPPMSLREVASCGQQLPILSTYDGPVITEIAVDEAALAAVLESLPEAARPALDQILNAPQTVGLAAYRAGQQENGVFLNAGVPLPLASVVKVVHLIAYAEAVAAGELSPTETVFLEDLDRFYYRLDQRAHPNALEGLEEDGRLFGQPPALILDEVVRMMIEYSSNAATDYVHMRLGQERIEQTALDLGLQSHTAPCPFLGQFLIMANPARAQISEQAALQFYSDNPQRYGDDVMQLTAAFSEDDAFREEALAWRRTTRRPDLFAQQQFSEQFNARGSAADYAALMARVAFNGLNSQESSFIARRQLEWPMQFPENQALFTNLAYKGGSLPGILTTVYYAYPIDDPTPVVVALFYHDLENSTYQQWRRSLAHDEFARWLLYEPAAVPALRALLTPPD